MGCRRFDRRHHRGTCARLGLPQKAITIGNQYANCRIRAATSTHKLSGAIVRGGSNELVVSVAPSGQSCCSVRCQLTIVSDAARTGVIGEGTKNSKKTPGLPGLSCTGIRRREAAAALHPSKTVAIISTKDAGTRTTRVSDRQLRSLAIKAPESGAFLCLWRDY